MAEQTWDWARLDDNGLALVEEAERTLGTDIVLVYAPGEPRAIPASYLGLVPADLDESQLDCLLGLERRIGAVAVAYRHAA